MGEAAGGTVDGYGGKDGMTDMILAREFDEPLSKEDVMAMALESGGCFSLYRVDWNQSFLAADGKRLLCWLTAPDAESARQALRQSGVGTHELWPGTLHDSAAAEAPSWDEANVVVERSWDEPATLDDIQAIEDAGAQCLETHRVRFARTFFSLDKKKMVCLYRAPDAESVRLAQRQAGMPLQAVWTCAQVRDLD
jgi:hypothetical protein